MAASGRLHPLSMTQKVAAGPKVNVFDRRLTAEGPNAYSRPGAVVRPGVFEDI
jgi:hypothetical protein